MPQQTKYELSAFDELLDARPHYRKRVIAKMLYGKSLPELEDEIAQNCYLAKHRIKESLCRCISNKQLTRYVRVHERDALKLLDCLEALLNGQGSDAPDENCAAVCHYLIAEMEGMLDFIEVSMAAYSDPELRVSNNKFSSAVEKISKDGLVLKAKMRSMGIQHELQVIVVNYINEFCSKPCCKHHELAYIEMLMGRLLNTLSSPVKQDWNRELELALIYKNFNRIEFLIYYRRCIATEADSEQTLKQQREKFLWHQKEISTLFVKENVGYNLFQLDLISGLLDYIAVELKYLTALEAGVDLQLPLVNFKARHAALEHTEMQRLKMGFSVPVIAFHIRLMIDVGMIAVEDGGIAGMARFISAHISTVGTEEVSAEQLVKHLKPKDAKTRDKMEEILQEMLQHLRTY